MEERAKEHARNETSTADASDNSTADAPDDSMADASDNSTTDATANSTANATTNAATKATTGAPKCRRRAATTSTRPEARPGYIFSGPPGPLPCIYGTILSSGRN